MRPSGQVIAGRRPYLSQPNIDRRWSIRDRNVLSSASVADCPKGLETWGKLKGDSVLILIYGLSVIKAGTKISERDSGASDLTVMVLLKVPATIEPPGIVAERPLLSEIYANNCAYFGPSLPALRKSDAKT